MVKDDFLNELFKYIKSSHRGKDAQKLEIICRKGEYEETLDKMWGIYMINPQQIIEYNKQVEAIKYCGCRVLRNSSGKHKIVILDED